MLAHPNLVRYNHVWLEVSNLSSFGPNVPCAFILQEYCNGGTLEEYMMKGRYSTNNQYRSDLRPHFQKESDDPAERIKAKKDRIRRRMSEIGSSGVSANASASVGASSSAGADSTVIDDEDFVVKLTIQEIISFMRDITKGVRYLHQNQIIHRDLKPSNCLLARNLVNDSDEDLPTVLVSDFGEGQLEGLHRMGSGSTGTLEYCAPELVQTVSGQFLAQFSKKTDIFSLGMILHYLCFSRLPYSNVWQERGDLEALTGEVREFEGFNMNVSNSKLHRTDLDNELLSLLDAMISINPDDRPNANEILYTLDEVWQRYLTNIELESAAATIIPRAILPVEPSSVPLNPSLVPTVSYSPIETTVPSSISRKISQSLSNQLILIKGALFLIKLVSLYNLPPSKYSQFIYTALGIELPILSIPLSLAFFILHFILVYVTSLSR